MVMEKAGQPLKVRDAPEPRPGPGQVLVRVAACAVCRTDLHVLDGELPDPKLPLILGHEIVGFVTNLTRRDGEEFLQLAPRIPVCTETQPFPLEQANEALACLREGRLQGAAVLVP